MSVRMILAAATTATALQATAFDIPGGGGRIGFDDLLFSAALKKLVVPAGRTGTLVLIDPASHAATTIAGFSAVAAGEGGHGDGSTSADFGRGHLFAIDRTAKRLDVVDPSAGKIVAFAPLGGSPDYVRFVEPANEVWVTEPDAERIEVFSLGDAASPAPKASGSIPVPGGPEALVIDGARGRAYTNLWKKTTVAIDLKSHTIVERWENGCEGSRGLALDAGHGRLFVGCTEGKATALDVAHGGKLLGSADAGAGVDIIAYDATAKRLYVPGGEAGTLTIIDVTGGGALTVRSSVPIAHGTHCVAVDDAHGVWMCDPQAGRLQFLRDVP